MHDTEDIPLAPSIGPLIGHADDSPRTCLNRIRDLDFRFVQLTATEKGLRPRELDVSARRDVLATLRRLELTVTGLDVWIPVDHFIQSSTVDRAVTFLLAAIDLAADFDRVTISTMMPESEEIVTQVAAHALRRGVEIADHVVPPSSHDGIGVGIDPAAWLANSDDPSQAIHKHASRIRAARLSDLTCSGSRAPIGRAADGQLDVTAYKVALAVCGLHHPVVIDARQWPEPWRGIEQTSRVWSSVASL